MTFSPFMHALSLSTTSNHSLFAIQLVIDIDGDKSHDNKFCCVVVIMATPHRSLCVDVSVVSDGFVSPVAVAEPQNCGFANDLRLVSLEKQLNIELKVCEWRQNVWQLLSY